MEKRYIDPNDLRAKFRSKSDLCKRLSVDCKHSTLIYNNSGYLPSILLEMLHQLHEAITGRREEVSLKASDHST